MEITRIKRDDRGRTFVVTSVPNESYLHLFNNLRNYNMYLINSLNDVKNKNYLKIVFVIQINKYIVWTPEKIEEFITDINNG